MPVWLIGQDLLHDEELLYKMYKKLNIETTKRYLAPVANFANLYKCQNVGQSPGGGECS